jgi:glycogen debranching enzyme
VEDAVRIANQWYVSVTSALADDRTRVLKAGATFAVFDRLGDIPLAGAGVHGLYHEGTRFLSRLVLRVNGRRPMLLNSSVRDDGLLTVDLTTPDLHDGDRVVVRKGTVHFFRARLLQPGGAQEHLRVTNYSTAPVNVWLTIAFAADYRDIFEVRGFERAQRGEDLAPEIRAARCILAYRGRDAVVRRTAVAFEPAPTSLDAQEAAFALVLAPGEARDLYVAIACEPGDGVDAPVSYLAALATAERARSRAQRWDVHSGHVQFDAWVRRSSADLALLVDGNPEGAYAYAGVPWFSTPFGRDGILTALQCLWLQPELARGTLVYLARMQADEDSAERDADPGKILHEARQGELAATGEIPFGRYYGSVDATPLFVTLAGAYYQRTGDLAFVRALWPHVERALEWIDRYGDADGDGFVEYRRRSSRGLLHQGWKDSEDAIFHSDGRLATGAIALVEVQGYVYAARRAAAGLARALDRPDRAAALESAAEALRERFEAAFWSEHLGMYALALDGDKRRCEVRASNAGHVLWSGIVRPDRARRTVGELLGPAFFSGWGVRTIAAGEPRFNPMSYHNGSVWPHDNALIAMGCARYGCKREALRILVALCEAAALLDLNRLPELYCGFVRRPGEGPTLYPVACAPQAWASAAVFYLLETCLGIGFEPDARRITLSQPMLPEFLSRLEVRNLQLADARVDLAFERHAEQVGVHVLAEEGGIEVAVLV